MQGLYISANNIFLFLASPISIDFLILANFSCLHAKLPPKLDNHAENWCYADLFAKIINQNSKLIHRCRD